MTFIEAVNYLKENKQQTVIHSSTFGEDLPYYLRIVGDNDDVELSVGLREVSLSVDLILSDAWEVE